MPSSSSSSSRGGEERDERERTMRAGSMHVPARAFLHDFLVVTYGGGGAWGAAVSPSVRRSMCYFWREGNDV